MLVLQHSPSPQKNMITLMTIGLITSLSITYVGIYLATYGFERIEINMGVDKARLKLLFIRWAFYTSVIVGLFDLITLPILLRQTYFGM